MKCFFIEVMNIPKEKLHPGLRTYQGYEEPDTYNLFLTAMCSFEVFFEGFNCKSYRCLWLRGPEDLKKLDPVKVGKPYKAPLGSAVGRNVATENVWLQSSC